MDAALPVMNVDAAPVVTSPMRMAPMTPPIPEAEPDRERRPWIVVIRAVIIRRRIYRRRCHISYRRRCLLDRLRHRLCAAHRRGKLSRSLRRAGLRLRGRSIVPHFLRKHRNNDLLGDSVLGQIQHFVRSWFGDWRFPDVGQQDIGRYPLGVHLHHLGNTRGYGYGFRGRCRNGTNNSKRGCDHQKEYLCTHTTHKVRRFPACVYSSDPGRECQGAAAAKCQNTAKLNPISPG